MRAEFGIGTVEIVGEKSAGGNKMKVCKMGLESVWINHADGQVRICGWTNYFIGKLIDSSIEELWNGEKAIEFRRSMLDGSYRYCNKKKCPHCANGTRDSLMVEYLVPTYPKYCSLSFEEACNYICKFCRTEKYFRKKNEEKNLRTIEKEINKFVNQLNVLSANGVGELFCSPVSLKILNNIKTDKNMEIHLESNGSLFNEKNWQQISNLGEHDLKVYITVHSFNQDTYQFLSGTKLSISNIFHNLDFISTLRKKEIINHFEIATVVCERNFREMKDFVKKCLNFEPDRIRLRFFEPYGVKNKSDEWFYDIRNPYHPYFEEFMEVMKDPIFTNPKVWKWQGETLSDLKEHPYFIEKKKVEILSSLIKLENISMKLEDYFAEMQVSNFSLYGMGCIGQAIIFLLDQNHVKFNEVLDSNATNNDSFHGHKVLRPNKESINKYDMIVVTSADYDEIKNILLDLNYKGKINHINELTNRLCQKN